MIYLSFQLGYVTQNQFRRGIPQNLLSQEEEDLLMSQYSDHLTSTVNYFKLNSDINRKSKIVKSEYDLVFFLLSL